MSTENASLEPDDGASVAAEGADIVPQEWIACWRCDKQVSAVTLICPFCEARLATGAVVTLPTRTGLATPPIVAVCGAFVLLLLVSLLQAGAMALISDAPGQLPLSTQRLHVMLGAEAADTFIVVCALIGTLGRVNRVSTAVRWRALAWACSPIVLAAALGMNIGYHALLRAFVDWPAVMEPTGFNPNDFTLVFLAVCVQPAIVEELFFRYLALGVLRGGMGVHGAVWVSSVMFGMAHVGNPLSIPVLFVLGLALGYSRILSGGLALPMLLHFAHNALVMFVE